MQALLTDENCCGLATIQMMMMTRKSELMVIDTITVVALCEMMTPILLKTLMTLFFALEKQNGDQQH